ncbi:MAG: PorT family protein [Flammeovirgaceae bacterium]|jgi:hypothetical protein|nr:PorT family protein [Flammeovirgaceae bacterium]
MAKSPFSETHKSDIASSLVKAMFAVAITLCCTSAEAQNIEAFGLYGGFNFPITMDEGLAKDPRYLGQLTFRTTPIGFSYGYDKVGFGFVLTPCYLQVGQQFIIRNSIAGEIGSRDIQMDYISLPIALKLHINDLAFFRLSAILGLNVNYLLKGRETISHAASKVTYPAGITIPTDPGYVAVYDGVFVPAVNDFEYVSNDKFNSIQLFAAVGLRSDFDLNDEWSINFDGRANFGLFDSRQTSYVNQLKNPSGGADFNGNPGAPDLPGQRRDIYLSVSIGISKIIQTKIKFKTKQTGNINRRGSNIPKPRNRRPKG